MLPKAPSLCPQGLCQHCLLLGIILTVLSGLLFDVAVSNVRPWVLEAREGECFMTSEIKAVGEVCIFFVSIPVTPVTLAARRGRPSV